MALFDKIPLEVQEQIFLNLTPKDLRNCSTVCSKWHDIINSNQIWFKMCAIEDLTGKSYLDDQLSLIRNPIRQFSDDVTFAPVCHWKSHFKRYKQVKKNWKIGYFVRSPIQFTPIHVNEKFIIQRPQANTIVIWDVRGKLKMACSVKVAVPTMNIDNIFWKGDCIVYTQQRLVVCLKRVEDSCSEIVRVKLEAGSCNNISSSCSKLRLSVSITERFILIQDHQNPCVFSFYDSNKGNLIKKIDLHKALGNMSLHFTCLEAIDDKVFVGYRMGKNSFFSKYNFSLDTWESPIPLQNEAINIYVTKKFVCVKLNPENRDTLFSFFHVWDHTTSMNQLEKVLMFYATTHLPLTMTENDLMTYHYRDEIKVLKLSTNLVKVLPMSRNVMKFIPIWDQYIVVLDDRGVSVWNWKSGEKVNCPYRASCVSTFYVSETNIIIRTNNDRFNAISFW